MTEDEFKAYVRELMAMYKAIQDEVSGWWVVVDGGLLLACLAASGAVSVVAAEWPSRW